MTRTTIRAIDRHDCEDDEGREYVVIEYRHFSIREPLNGPRQEVPGVREYRLSDGSDVNWIDDNTFQILANDRIIRRI